MFIKFFWVVCVPSLKPQKAVIHNMDTIVFSLTQAEGLVTGAAVGMFTIAGPVIVYGAAVSEPRVPAPVLPGYGG
jgi:hypothetical protein